MLSKRIIASLILKDGVVVQSLGFKDYLPVGSPEVAVEFLNEWGADEIVVLEIGENRIRRTPDYELVSKLSQRSLVPLTIGGGIDSIETMRELVHRGADKFVINRAAIVRPEIISEAARVFGNQCVVVSIDVKKTSGGFYEVFIDRGQTGTGKDPVEVAKQSASLGAGEIIIRPIERDGSKIGFDVELVRSISDAVNIPVIAAGGCGHPRHILDVFEKGNADAVAVGNFFHFTEHSIVTTKAFLKSHLSIRLDTHATYENISFDSRGRPIKQSDDVLERLRFEYHPKETI